MGWGRTHTWSVRQVRNGYWLELAHILLFSDYSKTILRLFSEFRESTYLPLYTGGGGDRHPSYYTRLHKYYVLAAEQG